MKLNMSLEWKDKIFYEYRKQYNKYKPIRKESQGLTTRYALSFPSNTQVSIALCVKKNGR